MGYDLHITRKQEWFDKNKNDIPLEEWLAIVQSDPEMRLDEVAEATLPKGGILRLESAGLSVWTAYSKHIEGRCMAYFSFHGGSIVVKNPDEEIRRKMYWIAQKLNAKVQGDEGEHYGPDGEVE